MQSINTGKQNSSFSWYSSNLPVTSIQVAKSEHSVSSEIPVSLVEGFKPISIKYDASPKILESARSVISMEDRIQASKSPKEPSRINKPIQSRLPLESVSHVAEKHSFTSSSPAAVPLKRAKIGMDKEIVDLEQSVDTLSLIEQERQSRIMSGANPVISGKMYNVQKEFMSQVQKSPYESFWQKGTEYYQSARKYLVSSNQQKVVGKIHRFSDHVETFEENGEMITFVWPRITSEIKAAEETARLERSTVDPVLFGKWKAINDEVKSMVASTYRSGLAQYDGQIIGRAAQAIDDAIHYTASLFASFGFFSRSYDVNWSRVLEEKERARRINNFSVDPMLDARKARVESELLKTVNAL